jgi:hypothetical protein
MATWHLPDVNLRFCPKSPFDIRDIIWHCPWDPPDIRSQLISYCCTYILWFAIRFGEKYYLNLYISTNQILQSSKSILISAFKSSMPQMIWSNMLSTCTLNLDLITKISQAWWLKPNIKAKQPEYIQQQVVLFLLVTHCHPLSSPLVHFPELLSKVSPPLTPPQH